MMEHIVIYDVEIAKEVENVPNGWDNPEGMGFASAVAYDYATDQYHFFLHKEDKPALIDLLHTKTAVTFNGIKFDSRVLLGNDRYLNPKGPTWDAQLHWGWDNIDLLQEYVKARFGDSDVGEAEARLGDSAIHDGSFSLDGLAEGTFDLHKTGHGSHAPILYQQEKYADLLSYNLQDVRLTRKIFEFIRQYGFIVDRKSRVINISLPK